MSILARVRHTRPSRRVAAAGAVVLALGGLAGCVDFQAGGDATAAAAVAPDCLKAKCVALTFDDGPGAATGRLLDILAEKHVHATFFMLGKQVKAHPRIVDRAVSEGHQIGDHTWDHKSLTALSDTKALRQITRTADEIEAASGIRPDVMRPPAGAINGRLARLIGLPAILWSVDTKDWMHHDTEKIVDTVREEAKPGSIVLMHDIHASTVDAVPRVIDQLKSDGFALVTVRELFESRLKPGGIYHGAEKDFTDALAAADKKAEKDAIKEYLATNGQPPTGAAPGPVVPRTSLPAMGDPAGRPSS